MRERRPAGEGEDEGQEIERERDDPEQRRRGEIGCDVRGDRKQQRRGHEGETDPAQPLAPAGPRHWHGTARRGAAVATGEPAQGDTAADENEPNGPALALRRQRQAWLDQQRIDHQREQAAGIASGVEEIGIGRGAMGGAREPVLQQRRRRGEREKRRPDGDRELADEPEHGNAFRRRRRLAQIERQEAGGAQQHQPMDRALGVPTEPGQQMGVEVAQQQHRLEEAHRRVPDRRRAAEPRQHHFRDHRLHQEQHPGAEEQRRGIGRQGATNHLAFYLDRICRPSRRAGTRSPLWINASVQRRKREA